MQTPEILVLRSKVDSNSATSTQNCLKVRVCQLLYSQIADDIPHIIKTRTIIRRQYESNQRNKGQIN